MTIVTSGRIPGPHQLDVAYWRVRSAPIGKGVDVFAVETSKSRSDFALPFAEACSAAVPTVDGDPGDRVAVGDRCRLRWLSA